MNRKETGDYLLLYFRKRSTSFLAHIYRAGITAEPRDIHRARLDVKKIFALFGLFEMVNPESPAGGKGYRLFRPLYRQAGKIREMQICRLLLSNPRYSSYQIPGFLDWIRRKEDRAIAGFTGKVKDFREKELKAIGREVETICQAGTLFRLRSKTRHYIAARTENIRVALDGSPGDRELHHMRQHLKAVSTILTLVQSVKPDRGQEAMISALNRIEMMIGDWHDLVVLEETARKYRKSADPENLQEAELLDSLCRELQSAADNLAQHFIPEVAAVIQLIARETEWEEDPV